MCMLKYALRVVYCLFLGRLWRQLQYISSMSEAQCCGLIREQYPPNTTPARAREPAPLRWKQNYRVVDLLVNYAGLIFKLYFERLLNDIERAMCK